MTEKNTENIDVDKIEENVEGELKKLPSDKIQHIVERHIKSGPLPDPDDFRKYEETLPGAADRILKLAETEQSHRHTVNEQDITKYHDNTFKLTKYGMSTALVAGVVGSISGVLISIFGNPWSGAIILLASILPIIVSAIKDLFKKESSNLPEDNDSD